MSKFIALQVGAGDSFFLRCLDMSILVDGGKAVRGFPAIFKGDTGQTHVNVLVCTHNDNDHANGVLGYLRDTSLTCDELWLPAYWHHVLSKLPTTLDELIDALADQLNGALEEPREVYDESAVEVLADALARVRDDRQVVDEDPPAGDDRRIGRLRPREAGADWPFPVMIAHDGTLQLPTRVEQGLLRRSQAGTLHNQVLMELLRSVGLIAAIAAEANRRAIPIRWFRYDLANPFGGEPFLKPVNSREVHLPGRSRLRLLDVLLLSIANRESLVFCSPERQAFPGVLFTADSDLVGQTLPTNLDHALVTAPHHGSESNAAAYTTIGGILPSMTPLRWARSGGMYAGQPGTSYKALTGTRCCTICALPAGAWSGKQAVRYYTMGTPAGWRWIRQAPTAPCVCA